MKKINNMDIKKINFLVIISFFPIFIFRSNLSINEIIFALFIFLVPILFITNLILNNNKKKNIFFKSYLSLIIVYGIDNHLGLWNGVIQPIRHDLIDIFGIIFVPGVILFIGLAVLVFFIILIAKEKFYRFILVFLCAIFIFGIFDQTKSYKQIKNFTNESDKKYYKTNLVIIFDEMSGINSFESTNDNTFDIDAYIKKFFKKYNFEFYSDVESISRNTRASVSALLNFRYDGSTAREMFLEPSSNYFSEHNLNENLFFEKYNDISVHQSMHINYCNSKNVSKCESYNPFIEKKFLNGFNDSYLTKIISIWKLNGSISSAIMWRSLRQLRIIDSILEPEGHKAAFPNLFKLLEIDIKSKKYDLIFVHSLVPHRPYGFDTKCNYDGSLALTNRYFSVDKMVKQHNLERKCTLFYLGVFLENLKENNLINSIDFTILSDHGARIERTRKDSDLSAIYAFRNGKTNYKEIKEKKILQKIFIEYFR